MRYRPEHYAAAFLEALRDTPTHSRRALVERFARFIARVGDAASAQKIITACARAIVRAHGGRWVTLEYARVIPKQLARRIGRRFSARDHIGSQVRPELIAGIRITVDEAHEIDATIRGAMNRMLR